MMISFSRTGWRQVLVVLSLLAVPLGVSGQSGYGGPSILSRSGKKAGERHGSLVDFNFHLGSRANTQAGLFPVQETSLASTTSGTLYGGEVEAGVYGGHAWRRSSIGLEYSGSHRKYHKPSFLDGGTHFLNLRYDQEVGKRFQVSLRQVAGTTNRAFAGYTAGAMTGQELPGVPDNEIFDSRSQNAQSSVAVSWRRSRRTEFTFTGEAFLIRRSNATLVDSNGARAGAQYSYRLNRRDSIGINYDFIHFSYPRVFGGSDIHGIAAFFSRQIGRSIQLSGTAGVYISETVGSQRVTLSPEVAAILGRTTGVEAFHSVNLMPQAEVSARYNERNWSADVRAGQSVSPGNGVYLTSQRQSVSGGYSYTGIRHWALNANFAYSRLKSLYQSADSFNSASAGFTGSYLFAPHWNLSMRGYGRTYSTMGLGDRKGYEVSVGVVYTSRQYPLSPW